MKYQLSYLLYTGVFWGGLVGFLAGLLVYNLIKMFKLDEDIQRIFNDAVAWFSTPPTAEEKAKMDELLEDPTQEVESELFGPGE